MILHALVTWCHGAWKVAVDAGVNSPSRDHLAAAATLYEQVRVGFQQVCSHERRRVHVLESVLRAAGRKVPQHGPVAKWRAVWVGFCDDAPGAAQQLLPRQPPAALVTAVHRGAPRPELAPPSHGQWPAVTRHIFVSGGADDVVPAAGWGLVAIDATTPGVNGWRQVAPAPPAVDLAGVVPVAASRLDPLAPSKAAGLQAVIEALRYVVRTVARVSCCSTGALTRQRRSGGSARGGGLEP